MILEERDVKINVISDFTRFLTLARINSHDLPRTVMEIFFLLRDNLQVFLYQCEPPSLT